MRSIDRAGVSHTQDFKRSYHAKCPLNLSNRVREAGKSVLT
jgi:hypothetical protein